MKDGGRQMDHGKEHNGMEIAITSISTSNYSSKNGKQEKKVPLRYVAAWNCAQSIMMDGGGRRDNHGDGQHNQ